MKKILCLIAALFCLPATSAAQTAVPLGADPGGRPTAPVSVNGRGPFPLVIDTAAQRTGLNAELIAELGLTPAEHGGAILHGATGTRPMDLYRLDAVSLGAETRAGLIATRIGHGGEAHGHGGVLGADFFAGKRVEFDFERNMLRIDGNAGREVPQGFTAVPARFVLGTFAIVPVTIGGVSAQALVDTGARHSIANPQLMRALGYSEADPRLAASEGSGGATGHAVTMRSGARAALRIGEMDIGEIDVSFADLPVFAPLGLAEAPAIIIGADVWRRLAAIALDHERQELQLRPEAR